MSARAAPSLLLALLLLWTPGRVQAAGTRDTPVRYAQGVEGYVHLSSPKGEVTERRKGRRSWEPVLAYSFTVENRLDAEVVLTTYELTYSQSGASERVSSETLGLPLAARSQSEQSAQVGVPSQSPVTELHVALTGYLLRGPTARTLLLLASAAGAVDQAVAAETLADLKPAEHPSLLAELRPLVAAGPEPLTRQFGHGVAPLYALRLLGRMGTAEDVPTLLSVMKSGEAYRRSQLQVELMRARHPDHPMTRLFASGTELPQVVRDALRDMRPEQAVPALVSLAYAPGPLRGQARTLLREWRPEELVAALRDPSAAKALQVLCASGQAEVVPHVVALGRAGGDVKACLTALPEKATVAALVGVLGEELGAFEATVYEVLAARSASAHPVLKAEARKLGLPVEPDAGTQARALRTALLSRQLGALGETLARVDGALREARFAAALESLEQARQQAHGGAQLARLALGYARLGVAAARERNEERVDTALQRLGELRAGQEPDAELESELVKLARLLVSQGISGWQEGRLNSLEPLVGSATRPTLAQVYMEANDPQRRMAYAKRALALEAGNAAAKQVLDEDARAQAMAQQRLYTLLGGVGLFVLGVIAVFAVLRRRANAQRSVLKRMAKGMLREGTGSQQVEDLLVFQEGLSRGDAAILVKEAEADSKWAA